MSKDHDHEFKIILLGESGVGKTSLTMRYTADTFKARCVKTVIVNSFSKTITAKGIKCKLSIWDTAGQEIYKSMVKGYYKNVDGALLVYDVTNVMTFNQLSSWLKEIRETSVGATALIVGNKTDLPNDSSVSRTMVEQFAKDKNLEFMESSAKANKNVIKIFEYLTLRILQDKQILPFDDHLSVSSFNSLDTSQEEVSRTPSTKAEQAELDPEKPVHNISETAFNNTNNSFSSSGSKDVVHKLHIFLAGGPAVGKYCLAVRHTTGKFDERGDVTVGARCFDPKFVVMNGIKIKLFIWVLAGHERYRSCLKLYYGRADGFLLVYDVTDIDSFNCLSMWLQDIKEVPGGDNALIVGNKIDLSNKLSVSHTVVEEFARNEHLEFMETSAKTGQNVDKIFEYLILKVLQRKGVLS